MKRFHDLTKEQKVKAIEFARSEFHKCADMGLIVIDGKKPTDKAVNKWSTEAAKGSSYTEEGEPFLTIVS